ncbi:MAG TPA: aldo/keto reductase [Polyangiaceae bacterium]|nr:aldo/keto reductase [Polyangiaceae bacterium]
METRRLGTSDLELTVIGLGAWAIGGSGWEYGWGAQDDRESVAAIRRALDHGINWIDTAAIYGLGHSEEIVARALDGIARRPYVFTKCGLVCDARGAPERNLSAASLRAECEASLRRLRVEVIDLYQVHWPNPDIVEAWETLAALRREGKVRWIGVSNYSVAQMDAIRPIAPITSLQPPYSLLDRSIEGGELPYCREHQLGVIVYSPMGSGLLSGTMTAERVAALPADDWRRRNQEFQAPRLARNLALVDVLAEVGAAHGRSAGEVAIAWTLRRSEVTGAIVGARSAAQVDGWVGAATLRLSPDEIARIDAFVTASP